MSRYEAALRSVNGHGSSRRRRLRRAPPTKEAAHRGIQRQHRPAYRGRQRRGPCPARRRDVRRIPRRAGRDRRRPPRRRGQHSRPDGLAVHRRRGRAARGRPARPPRAARRERRLHDDPRHPRPRRRPGHGPLAHEQQPPRLRVALQRRPAGPRELAEDAGLRLRAARRRRQRRGRDRRAHGDGHHPARARLEPGAERALPPAPGGVHAAPPRRHCGGRCRRRGRAPVLDRCPPRVAARRLALGAAAVLRLRAAGPGRALPHPPRGARALLVHRGRLELRARHAGARPAERPPRRGAGDPEHRHRRRLVRPRTGLERRRADGHRRLDPIRSSTRTCRG